MSGVDGMDVLGREWHEDDALALAIHDALVMQSKSLGNTLQTARAAKIAAEAARQHDRGAVGEVERLRAALRDLKSLMPAITGNAEEVVRRVDQELALPTSRGQ